MQTGIDVAIGAGLLRKQAEQARSIQQPGDYDVSRGSLTVCPLQTIHTSLPAESRCFPRQSGGKARTSLAKGYKGQALDTNTR